MTERLRSTAVVASAVGTLALHGFIGYWLIFVGQKPMRFADGQVAVTPFSLTLINPVSASASKNEPEIPQLTRDAAWRTLKASLIDLDPPPHLKITTESSPEGPRQSTMTADAASFLRMCRSRGNSVSIWRAPVFKIQHRRLTAGSDAPQNSRTRNNPLPWWPCIACKPSEPSAVAQWDKGST